MKTKLLSLLFVTLVIFESFSQESEQSSLLEPQNVPFQISFIPGFGTAGFLSKDVNANVSLNILGGYVNSVDGLELGGLVNIVHQDVKGAQMAGQINVVGRDVTGFQGAGLVNVVLQNQKGVQAGGLINTTLKASRGGQLAGLANYAQSSNGVQAAGLANVASGESGGAQLAGLGNYATDVKGIQAAGLINISAKGIDGAQVSGLINFAPKVKGLQIGIVNIADTVERGAMIGLFNFVRKGMHKFELSHDDVTDFNASFRGGTHRFYSILTVGLKPQNDAFWSSGLGFGTQMNIKEKYYANVEATSNWMMNTGKQDLDGTYLLNRLNVNVGYKINDYLSVNAGPVLNVYVVNPDEGEEGNSLARLGTNGFYDKKVDGSNVRMWMGYRVAFRF